MLNKEWKDAEHPLLNNLTDRVLLDYIRLDDHREFKLLQDGRVGKEIGEDEIGQRNYKCEIYWDHVTHWRVTPVVDRGFGS